MMKHLLGIRDLTTADILQLYELADRFYEVLQQPTRKAPALSGKTVALLFFESSTRTKLSFELAAKRLGADVLNFSASGSSLSKGETLLDTALNILAMGVDAFVVRHHGVGTAHFLAAHLPTPVINAGDGTHEHPTQALLDTYTLRKHFGYLEGLTLTIIGDLFHSRVALSHLHIAPKLGLVVRLCAPPTLVPPLWYNLGFPVYHRVEDAIKGANALLVLRMQKERQAHPPIASWEEYARFYQVRPEHLSEGQVLMHPGPINWGVELHPDLIRSGASRILDQVTHGVAIRMAILYALLLQ
ncbi:MAG: aspartate carbamoyltransferase catalytic subunit [Bacteroidia bacterium]|nr:aspartate carbamoyltransferase catalytic subunit [Bacteroidia bacterium]MCX7652797.1 aspartate carbamoyltransferase catalytic subunit [Bacteroidia bacterium]MDW8417218.1 aspartate carbamoyltransferase catalytic subunit [Bacteroidia bacterium]